MISMYCNGLSVRFSILNFKFKILCSGSVVQAFSLDVLLCVGWFVPLARIVRISLHISISWHLVTHAVLVFPNPEKRPYL